MRLKVHILYNKNNWELNQKNTLRNLPTKLEKCKMRKWKKRWALLYTTGIKLTPS